MSTLANALQTVNSNVQISVDAAVPDSNLQSEPKNTPVQKLRYIRNARIFLY